MTVVNTSARKRLRYPKRKPQPAIPSAIVTPGPLKGDGWAVGSDQNVVVIDKGAGASFDSTTLSHKVVAIQFGQNGLMAGLALQGSKITTYNPNA